MQSSRAIGQPASELKVTTRISLPISWSPQTSPTGDGWPAFVSMLTSPKFHFATENKPAFRIHITTTSFTGCVVFCLVSCFVLCSFFSLYTFWCFGWHVPLHCLVSSRAPPLSNPLADSQKLRNFVCLERWEKQRYAVRPFWWATYMSISKVPLRVIQSSVYLSRAVLPPNPRNVAT